MKSISIKILIFLGILLPATFVESEGQKTNFQGFSLKVSPGALVYYGDLSTNNLNLPKRIFTGSKFGIGASMTKQFSPFFGIQAQFMTGNLYTESTDNTYFTGSLTEFSLSARFDPLKLIKKNTFKLSPYFSAGVGTFGFRTVRREIGTNLVLLPNFGYEKDGLTKTTRQTAMSMPLAVGLSYQVLPFMEVEVEHSIRMTNTDLLDCFKGPSTANDMYSLTSIGFRFSIPSRSVPVKPEPPVVQSIPMKPVTDSSELNVYVDCQLPETVAAGKTMTINIRILKGKYRGPGKLTQKYPSGFTAISDNTHEYSLIFSNQNVIISWTKMPVDSIVNLSYEIRVGENLAGSQSIAEKFEYEDATGPKLSGLMIKFLLKTKNHRLKTKSQPTRTSGRMEAEKRLRKLRLLKLISVNPSPDLVLNSGSSAVLSGIITRQTNISLPNIKLPKSFRKSILTSGINIRLAPSHRMMKRPATGTGLLLAREYYLHS
jgi:hypothetical protein